MKDWNTRIDSLHDLFKRYSFEDLANSIFISSLWIGNVASPIKHQLLTYLLMNINSNVLSKSNQISDYKQFELFLKEAITYLPDFPSIEDYIPEPDWGNSKYYLDNRYYKMFYGCELSNIYDYMQFFELLFTKDFELHLENIGRSPILELQDCLSLQDLMIKSITINPSDLNPEHITPGHIELPPNYFWTNCLDFISSFNPQYHLNMTTVSTFSFIPKTKNQTPLSEDKFIERIFSDTFLDYILFNLNDKYIPILPRRYLPVLLESWFTIFNSSDYINVDGMHFGSRVFKYLSQRFTKKSILPLVSAIKTDESFHEIIFPFVIIEKKNVILTYVCAPTADFKSLASEIDDVNKSINEALELIKSRDHRIALHRDKSAIAWSDTSESQDIELKCILLIPQVTTQAKVLPLPEDFQCEVMFIDSFLAIFDEVGGATDIIEFFKFKNGLPPGSNVGQSDLDLFGAFIDSHGVISDGAEEPNFLVIDPHWGSSYRFISLANFWKSFPEILNFDHPRSWKIKSETKTRLRMQAKSYFGFFIYFKMQQSSIFTSSPFHDTSQNQAKLCNLLMECLEDSLSRNVEIFKDFDPFMDSSPIEILFFPNKLVNEDKSFTHLHHLLEIDNYWSMDFGVPASGWRGVRVVFNEETVTQAFTDVSDGSLEYQLMVDILNILEPKDNKKLDLITSKLKAIIPLKPRFRIFQYEQEVSFPEHVDPWIPKTGHFKRSVKKIAQLAKSEGITPGDYNLDEAKEILNRLRDKVVSEINNKVYSLNYHRSLPVVISKVDALIQKWESSKRRIELSKDSSVDYIPKEMYSVDQKEFIKWHKDYRYLLEKLVSISPLGFMRVSKDSFQDLIALIDWLLVIYTASDSLHYNISPLGIHLDSEFRLSVRYSDNIDEKEDEYAKYQAQIHLGEIGNQEDTVDYPSNTSDYINKLNNSMKRDLNFRFDSMIQIMKVLSQWVSYSDVELSTYYSASMKQIVEVCTKNIIDLNKNEIPRVLDFLTLKPEEILVLSNSEEVQRDIPVWEYNKRPNRYTLKPLMLIENNYYWGPHSAKRAGLTWSSAVGDGHLPASFNTPSLKSAVDEHKHGIEHALVLLCQKVVERYSKLVKVNFELNSIKSDDVHPEDLGDYDIFAYIPESNILIHIECKDLLQVYSLKDAKRLRERIFGRTGKGGGHYEKVLNRHSYLMKHGERILAELGWKIESQSSKLLKIYSVFVTRYDYWWTKYPPYDVPSIFLRVETLDSFIKKLNDDC